MREGMRKFIRFQDKLYWVDMETYDVMVIEQDGTIRAFDRREDDNMLDVLIRGDIEEPAHHVETSDFFRTTGYQ